MSPPPKYDDEFKYGGNIVSPPSGSHWVLIGNGSYRAGGPPAEAECQAMFARSQAGIRPEGHDIVPPHEQVRGQVRQADQGAEGRQEGQGQKGQVQGQEEPVEGQEGVQQGLLQVAAESGSRIKSRCDVVRGCLAWSGGSSPMYPESRIFRPGRPRSPVRSWLGRKHQPTGA